MYVHYFNIIVFCLPANKLWYLSLYVSKKEINNLFNRTTVVCQN